MSCIEKIIENGESTIRPCRGSLSTKNHSINGGPGTELKKLLGIFGIQATPNCSCNARAIFMDRKEANDPGWCEKNIDTIIGWLREEANKRKLPFFDIAAKVLVKKAIKNFQKNNKS